MSKKYNDYEHLKLKLRQAGSTTSPGNIMFTDASGMSLDPSFSDAQQASDYFDARSAFQQGELAQFQAEQRQAAADQSARLAQLTLSQGAAGVVSAATEVHAAGGALDTSIPQPTQPPPMPSSGSRPQVPLFQAAGVPQGPMLPSFGDINYPQVVPIMRALAARRDRIPGSVTSVASSGSGAYTPVPSTPIV